MEKTVFWQRFEGAFLFVAALTLFAVSGSGVPWWLAVPLFFVPDLGFVSFRFGPRVGAFVYNLVHIYAPGLVLMALGSVLTVPLLVGIGTLWVAHCGLDRMLGYGLKLDQGFHYTHLGRVGKGA